jgi:thiol-disulfide isomerase/thioredoxin
MPVSSSNRSNYAKVERISAVIAKWCPHCYPLSVDNSKRMADELDVPIRVLDIDREEDVKIADRLVKEYGDNADDYLIPQIFLEFKDGNVKHIFTGFSENPEVTKARWADLFNSKFYGQIKKLQQYSN